MANKEAQNNKHIDGEEDRGHPCKNMITGGKTFCCVRRDGGNVRCGSNSEIVGAIVGVELC